MYIQHTAVADPDSNVSTRRLRHSDVTDGDWVTFNIETGKAQVTREVGEQLIEHYDAIESASDADSNSDEDS